MYSYFCRDKVRFAVIVIPISRMNLNSWEIVKYGFTETRLYVGDKPKSFLQRRRRINAYKREGPSMTMKRSESAKQRMKKSKQKHMLGQ